MPYKDPEERKEHDKDYNCKHRGHRSQAQRDRNPEYLRRPHSRFLRGKHQAKHRGKSWTLTEAQWTTIIAVGVCFYCSGELPPTGCGLDRKDHKIGYEFGNVVACCQSCNQTKGKLESAGFLYPRTVELLVELLCGFIKS